MDEPITDFEKQINTIIAPVTNAWTDWRMTQIQIKPGDIKEDSIECTIVVRAKRRTDGLRE